MFYCTPSSSPLTTFALTLSNFETPMHSSTQLTDEGIYGFAVSSTSYTLIKKAIFN